MTTATPTPTSTSPSTPTTLTTPTTSATTSEAEPNWSLQDTQQQSIDQISAALMHVASVLLDPSLYILQVSASFLSVNNLTYNECVGLNIYELIRARGLAPGATSLQNAISAAVATRNVYTTVDLEAAGQDSRPLRVMPIFDKDTLVYIALEVCETISESQNQHRSSDQLDTDDTYRILVETVKDYAIFMLDVKGNVKTWNAGAALLKGYRPEEIIGRHFSTFYGEEDIIAEKPKKELEICLREGKVEDESWRYRKDGSRFWANVIITSVYRRGVHIGFSKVTRDLTERMITESRLASAYEESAKLKSAFLANISHEIRTPMHGMLSALTLLMDSSLTPEQRELGGIIQESGTVLLQLINDILDFSKLTSGTFSICSNIISVRDIISSVVRSFQATSKSEISFPISLDPKLPKSAHGDPVRYRQVIQNLISNAVKFTESGSVHVRAWVKCDDDKSYIVRTEIADTGIGIPDYAVGSLFAPFTQFDISATKRYKGTGLGLSICKSLAELMGGSIGFHRNPDARGSVFWFDIKIEKLGSEGLPKTQQQDLESAKLTSSLDLLSAVKAVALGRRILLAEDNPINQKVMLMMLKNLGFQKIDTAMNGAEAVQLAKKDAIFYHLILMDINMPVLDGIGSTREIRKAGVDVPIIAMTANALKGDVDVYLARGMNDYIPKPVDRQLLLKTLLKWLK